MRIPSKKRNKRQNPSLKISAIDVARWYIQDNLEELPPDLVSVLSGALRARNTTAIRKCISTWDSPQLYNCPRSYFIVAQLFALLSKVPFPFGGGDAERRAVAIGKFDRSEKTCRIATKKLDHYNSYPHREDPCMRVILARARALVDEVLGEVDGGVHSVLESGRFGPGMTACSVDSAQTTPYYKLVPSDARSVTHECIPFFEKAILANDVLFKSFANVDWASRTCTFDWRVVQSCKLAFVPKDESSFRTIAIEPYGNIFCQLGLNAYICKRLKTRAGIDVRSQIYNQKGAQRGSEDWSCRDSLSTIDLSSASDCVSPGLVRRLVRPQWIALLDALRSKFYTLDGVEKEFSKWSSMGNGYTFSLETLLFWALAQACENTVGTNQKALAYGDDIVVSRDSSLLVLQVLRYVGFRVNYSKTFIVGPFRESCGADFHTGVNVRPTFIRTFDIRVSDVFRLLNTLCVGSMHEHDGVFSNLLSSVPEDLMLYGSKSDDVSDSFHVPLWYLKKLRPKGFRYDRNTQSFYSRRLVFKPKIYGGIEYYRYLAWQYSFCGGQHSNVPSTYESWENIVERYYPDSRECRITQRKRGVYRLSSKRCQIPDASDRSIFYLT